MECHHLCFVFRLTMRGCGDTHQLQIMKGAHAACNADANLIQHNILLLSHNDTKKRSWAMPAMIEKVDRGIKSESTVQFLLPFTEHVKYLEDPEA